ncbi:MAG: phospholipase D-like domain-containing protein [Sphingosinicella sp.]
MARDRFALGLTEPGFSLLHPSRVWDKRNRMELVLHAPHEACSLPKSYRRAVSSAKELLVVSAYLTNWSRDVDLNPKCERFRMIVGKDFGITRKAACESVLGWLPKRHRVHFRVADQIMGFHPKAVFWRENDGKCYAIIGSSNLSSAAFESNYEANVVIEIDEDEFVRARDWIDAIATLSVPVSKDWLANYEEAKVPAKRGGSEPSSNAKSEFKTIRLPRPRGSVAAVRARREVLRQHRRNREELLDLFRRCAAGQVSSSQFYNVLPEHWGNEAGGRLQGKGWERSGSKSNFRRLCKSFVRIVDAPASRRDDVVVEEIDALSTAGVPTRRAFLSEMLCLEFPKQYPVINRPVHRYLADVKFRGAAGLSEGAKYLDLALRLRFSLSQNPNHPAKNLAELDTVIWLAYDD